MKVEAQYEEATQADERCNCRILGASFKICARTSKLDNSIFHAKFSKFFFGKPDEVQIILYNFFYRCA